MTLSDRHLDPPEDCSACEEYYSYKDGLCYECWYAAQEDKAVEKYERRQLEEMENDNG